MQGPHVLLSYYVARVISCGPGALSSFVTLPGLSLWFFRTCLGLVELLRTYEVHFSASGCALHPGLCLGWAPWGIPCYVFLWLSFLELGWSVLCFRHGFCGEGSGPSLAPRFAGFTVPAQPMGDCYILCGRLGVTWSAWAAHRQRCDRFPFATGCNMRELLKTTVSFWLRMPLSRVCWLSVTERSVSCPLNSVRSCYRSVSSL